MVGACDLFLEIRKCRSPEEVRLQRIAAAINYRALLAVLEAAKPGVPYAELARASTAKGLLWSSRYRGEHVPARFTLKNNSFFLQEGKQYI